MANETTEWIKDVLTNDEVSTDEELVELFKRNGVPEKEARQWVAQRNNYLGKI